MTETQGVESDGRTVWVHTAAGFTVARFSMAGIDVHTPDAAGCLNCKPGPTTLADWVTFRRDVATHHGIYVEDSHRPEHLAGTTSGQVVAAVRSWRYSYVDEYQLQDGLAAAFERAGLPFVREAPIGKDRIDFLVAGSVGVELKVAGSDSALLAQVLRYSLDPRIADLVVVTTRLSHRRLPSTVGPCPLTVIYVGTGI